MKKQNLKLLTLNKRAIFSKLANENAIMGGATTFCVTFPLCEVTAYHRCGHTIGNGQNPDGSPCTV